MTTPLDLVADNRKWLRLHEHNKYQAEAARRITVLLAEVERLSSLLAYARESRDAYAATLDRVRALADGWDQCIAAEEDDYARSLLRAAQDDLRTALEGTDS